MDKKEILRIFEETGALQKGHFELSSGLHSGQYMQCALVLQHPKYAKLLCGELAANFTNKKITVVVGPALGGVIVSHEVARSLGVRSIFTERKEGKMTLRRGFTIDKKDRVLIVEDVVTTGRSTKEVLDIIKKTGAQIVGIGSIINRAKENVFQYDFKRLVNVNIQSYNPADCPLCKDGIPVVKPGSRKSL